MYFHYNFMYITKYSIYANIKIKHNQILDLEEII